MSPYQRGGDTALQTAAIETQGLLLPRPDGGLTVLLDQDVIIHDYAFGHVPFNMSSFKY